MDVVAELADGSGSTSNGGGSKTPQKKKEPKGSTTMNNGTNTPSGHRTAVDSLTARLGLSGDGGQSGSPGGTGGSGAAGEGDSNTVSLRRLAQEWIKFDLEGQRASLDSAADEIATKQDGSLASRKHLAQITKAFRNYNDGEKLTNFKGLLRSYQQEVDTLTRRAKSAELAFLNVYRRLAEIPDPVPGLLSASNSLASNARASELELENKRLEQELEEFRRDFREIQNQEVTIARLQKENRSYEQNMEQLLADRVKSETQALRAEIEGREAEAKLECEKLRRQVETAERDLRTVQHSHDIVQSELFNMKTNFEEERSALQAAYDMLSEDLERAIAEKNSAEASKSDLESRLRREAEESATTSTSPDLELALAQKELEVSRLTEQLIAKEEAMEKLEVEYEERLGESAKQLDGASAEKTRLAKELATRPTTEEVSLLRDQLSVLKSLEYNLDEVDVRRPDAAEQLLKQKNKALEGEVVRLKNQKSSLESTAVELRRDLDENRTLVERQKKLIVELEDDIMANSASLTGSQDLTSTFVRGDVASRTSLSNLESGNNANTVDSGSSNTSGGEATQATSTSGSGDNAMLQVVCSQRDRFKSRMLNLEQEQRSLSARLNDFKRDNASLKADNVQLFEKIKYLQSFVRQRKNVQVDAKLGALEDRYGALYEDTVDPFAAFHRREKADRFKALNPAERITLHAGRFFLGTRATRTFLFVYTLALHLLVFTVVYWRGDEDACLVQVPMDSATGTTTTTIVPSTI